MSPKPYVFKNEYTLVRMLKSKSLLKVVKKYYNRKINLESIIKYQVSSNTYRAFRKSASGLSPSDVFRKWVKRFIIETSPKIRNIRSQSEYDRFVDTATKSLCKYWKSKMKYDLGYGRGAKLLNLILKILPIYEQFLVTQKTRKQLISFLHVPLDSFIIQGLRNIAKFNIPSNASMGFIGDAKTYREFQILIRQIAKQANVSPIYFDMLAWDISH